MRALQQAVEKRNPSRLFLHLIMLLVILYPAAILAAQPALIQIDGGLIQEKRSGLIWQMERSKKFRSQEQVEKYLNQLNQGPHHDWRLPTKWELYDFIAKFDLKINGDIRIPFEGSYWLKDDNGTIHPGSWETGDQCGPERGFFTTKSGYVRAVRP